MKSRILLIGFFLVTGYSLQAQILWAGPDTVSCGNKGVIIGSPYDCPDCCFSWTPTEGLDDPKAKNPRARPRKKTTYTVVVTDANLSMKITDEVVVDLSFGEMRFTPKFLEQGTDDVASVELKNNVGSFNTTWSFEGDSLGCIITPTGNVNIANVMAGDEYGKLLVKVARTSDTACYFIDTLPVNNGVKDLVIIDKNNPNRFARTGESLYLVGDTGADVIAILKAIPNEGGFKQGIPDYEDDSYGSSTPIDGDAEQEVQEQPFSIPNQVGNPSAYIAGDEPDYSPQVYVFRIIGTEDTSPAQELISALYGWWQEFEALFNYDDILLEPTGPGDPDPPCPPVVPLVSEGTFEASIKDTEVEKFGQPGLGKKTVIALDAGINVTGKIYHPGFTRHHVIFGIGICTELSASASLVTTLHLAVTKDESLEDQTWNLNDPQIEMAISGKALAKGTLLGGETGFKLTLSGTASTAVKGTIDYKVATRQFIAQAKVEPATIKVQAQIESKTNLGVFKPLFNLPSQSFVLFKGLVTDPLILYTIPESQ